MPSRLLVAGLDTRSLILAAPVLQRDPHLVEEKPSAAALLEDLAGRGARMVVLGPSLHDLDLAATIHLIRSSPITRRVSIVVLLPPEENQERADEALRAGASAVLRGPVDERHVEDWLARLLAVTRRLDARVSVQGEVVGTPLPA